MLFHSSKVRLGQWAWWMCGIFSRVASHPIHCFQVFCASPHPPTLPFSIQKRYRTAHFCCSTESFATHLPGNCSTKQTWCNTVKQINIFFFFLQHFVPLYFWWQFLLSVDDATLHRSLFCRRCCVAVPYSLKHPIRRCSPGFKSGDIWPGHSFILGWFWQSVLDQPEIFLFCLARRLGVCHLVFWCIQEHPWYYMYMSSPTHATPYHQTPTLYSHGYASIVFYSF